MDLFNTINIVNFKRLTTISLDTSYIRSFPFRSLYDNWMTGGEANNFVATL